MQQRDTERQQIANELANVVQSTQEKTLPAVKMAELLIEQAIDEGNMEVQTTEEKYQAKVEKAKELLANPSLLQASFSASRGGSSYSWCRVYRRTTSISQ